MNRIALRRAQKGDASALAQLWLETGRYYAAMDSTSFQVPNADGLTEWFETFLDESPKDDELSLVAEIDDEVVGSIEARLLEPTPDADRQMMRELSEIRVVVNQLGVAQAHWRSGVGTALMEAAERWGKERGATQVGVDTYISSPVSVPFYEKRLGYKRHSINFRKRL